MDVPRLSVVIPVWNRAGTIAWAIASLEMTGPFGAETELIVVDDGSRDGSAEAAEKAIAERGLTGRATVLRTENGGASLARNRGAEIARGAHVAFLDSDDFWLPGTLAACHEALDRHPDAALVFLATVDVARTDGPPSAPDPSLDIARHAGFLAAYASRPHTRLASCNVIVSAPVFRRLGGFSPQFRCSEDSDLFLRADGEGACLVVSRAGGPLVAHVVGEADSLSANLPCVVSGFHGMIESDRAGAYPGDAASARLRRSFLASGAVYTARIAFAQGASRQAYALLLGHLGLIWRGRQHRWIWRLALYPLLARLRPETYPMRRAA